MRLRLVNRARSIARMVLLRRRVNSRGLSLEAKEKVYVKRKIDKKSWLQIAREVYNVAGGRPYWKVVRAAFRELTSNRSQRKVDKYANCGRKKVLTPILRKWLVKKMKELRCDADCTSTDLQLLLAREKRVVVEASSVRRALHDEGYYYLPRDNKPKYDKHARAKRVEFSKRFAKCSLKSQKGKCNLCLDGVVFTRPPSKRPDRENYIHSETRKVWRRKDEHNLPELAGYDRYSKQAPPSRIIPLWGGVGPAGFAPVLWHDNRKTDHVEWSAAVTAGNLTKALQATNPGKRIGPWKVLCDNESFLEHERSVKAYRKRRVSLLKIPPKSPDLNPVEKFWGWARKGLHKMDLADLRAGREVPGKTAYKERVRRFLCSAVAQKKARNFYGNLRTLSKKIVEKKGHAVKG